MDENQVVDTRDALVAVIRELRTAIETGCQRYNPFFGTKPLVDRAALLADGLGLKPPLVFWQSEQFDKVTLQYPHENVAKYFKLNDRKHGPTRQIHLEMPLLRIEAMACLNAWIAALHGVVLLSAAQPKSMLTQTEQDIVDAIGDGQYLGREVAKKSGYRYDTARRHLANLVKRGILGSVDTHLYWFSRIGYIHVGGGCSSYTGKDARSCDATS